ncbi:MAG: UDP-N-acetylmuramoyl-tripeptide--D-alanyl-D-alanine ligase [Prevotella sp.]|nr:UDP-N-acetylmuramoyl-tripeptide--D-alanyl-D-alanine ligase [Prevotella sp.]
MDIKQLYELYRQHPTITTDSRESPEGSIFLALKGDKFDGNRFAAQALAKGCALAIVDDAAVAASDPRCILVDDTLQTFKDIAREHRRQFDIPVIGITGTNGKTTTKELIRAVLSKKYNVLATEGNLNNDVGVPKTLLRLRPEHEIAIIEMGASHPGDIKTLAETAEPTCGLITNVGRAHLQGFGSFEGVCRTKGELYDYLRSRQDGLVFINADSDELVDMLTDDLWCTPYSTDPEKQYSCISGEVMEGGMYLRFRWRKPLMELEQEGASQKWHKVQTQLVGAYNIYNALAAIAVGINFGVDRKMICQALEEYHPTNNRSQLTETEHNRLIVDAYNANPSSMQAALENFSQIPAQRKMLILGDMRELGPTSQEEHQGVVNYIETMEDLSDVWLVGQEFAKTDNHFRHFDSADDVKAAIAQEQPEGRLILIKGSNSMRLYELPPLL